MQYKNFMTQRPKEAFTLSKEIGELLLKHAEDIKDPVKIEEAKSFIAEAEKNLKEFEEYISKGK